MRPSRQGMKDIIDDINGSIKIFESPKSLLWFGPKRAVDITVREAFCCILPILLKENV